jgi:hypothetical protein
MCVYFSTLLTQRNLIVYGIPHVSTIDIQMHEHTVVEKNIWFELKRDIQVNLQSVIT